ncbi:aldo/keto reductase [Evansella cellulosilytica]|uniref:Aldo/keto reductase n=1 Tax=Evansella cellulosilytica (strain ATCC 21833 / DSM 2522 / FERM P-1141 / JCM 9156 / N-4) TaxID=649639 RepID=E6TYJ1_EVAC2|nr:aldo/keto reductase [Evansella cellulosilytica]ADU30041.1 aldo/keto reductase [Evansella cellulosilytica DSM 2522]
MKKNKLGSSALYVSEIGFGCMSLSKDHSENERIIHHAIDRGVNFFDTADLYDRGMNEVSVGKALKEKRKDIIIATKGGNEWRAGTEGWNWNPSKTYIVSAVKKSLQRLQTDYIDLYQLHGGTIDDPIDETIEAFEQLVKEGCIRYYGISSIRPNVIQAYLKKSNIVSIMMQFSLLDRRPEEWLQQISDNQVSVIARGPVAKGILTNDFKDKITDKGYLDYSPEELVTTVTTLSKIAEQSNISLQHLALRYVLNDTAVATTIPGASRLEQLDDNIFSSKVKITNDLIKACANVTKNSTYNLHRN